MKYQKTPPLHADEVNIFLLSFHDYRGNCKSLLSLSARPHVRGGSDRWWQPAWLLRTSDAGKYAIYRARLGGDLPEDWWSWGIIHDNPDSSLMDALRAVDASILRENERNHIDHFGCSLLGPGADVDLPGLLWQFVKLYSPDTGEHSRGLSHRLLDRRTQFAKEQGTFSPVIGDIIRGIMERIYSEQKETEKRVKEAAPTPVRRRRIEL